MPKRKDVRHNKESPQKRNLIRFWDCFRFSDCKAVPLFVIFGRAVFACVFASVRWRVHPAVNYGKCFYSRAGGTGERANLYKGKCLKKWAGGHCLDSEAVTVLLCNIYTLSN
jgi:hypothetical protein